jgi:hypothetical protein
VAVQNPARNQAGCGGQQAAQPKTKQKYHAELHRVIDDAAWTRRKGGRHAAWARRMPSTRLTTCANASATIPQPPSLRSGPERPTASARARCCKSGKGPRPARASVVPRASHSAGRKRLGAAGKRSLEGRAAFGGAGGPRRAEGHPLRVVHKSQRIGGGVGSVAPMGGVGHLVWVNAGTRMPMQQ